MSSELDGRVLFFLIADVVPGDTMEFAPAGRFSGRRAFYFWRAWSSLLHPVSLQLRRRLFHVRNSFNAYYTRLLQASNVPFQPTSQTCV